MYRYIKSASTNNSPKSFGYGSVWDYDGKRVRKTHLTKPPVISIPGRGISGLVFEDADKTDAEGNKQLYYKLWDTHLYETSYRYCYDPEHPDREYIPIDKSDTGEGYYK